MRWPAEVWLALPPETGFGQLQRLFADLCLIQATQWNAGSQTRFLEMMLGLGI